MTPEQPIDLNGGDEEVARWIWTHLVPKSGQSRTLQGELLRAVEKLRWEAQNNGNINWDDRFVMFIDFLQERLLGEPGLNSAAKHSIMQDLDRLRHFLPVDQLADDSQAGLLPYVEDDLYDRLTAHVVSYCRLHPKPLVRVLDPRQYR